MWFILEVMRIFCFLLFFIVFIYIKFMCILLLIFFEVYFRRIHLWADVYFILYRIDNEAKKFKAFILHCYDNLFTLPNCLWLTKAKKPDNMAEFLFYTHVITIRLTT